MTHRQHFFISAFLLFVAGFLCMEWNIRFVVLFFVFSWTLLPLLLGGNDTILLLLPITLISFLNLYYWEKLGTFYRKHKRVSFCIGLLHLIFGMLYSCLGYRDVPYIIFKCSIVCALCTYSLYSLILLQTWRGLCAKDTPPSMENTGVSTKNGNTMSGVSGTNEESIAQEKK